MNHIRITHGSGLATESSIESGSPVLVTPGWLSLLNRTGFLLFCLLAALGESNWLRAADTDARLPAKPNVLFIAVDDLRPELGCYGKTYIHSPNIDRLAGEGRLFERAYCQQAICMASRASLLSGYRPDVGKIYHNGPLYKAVPNAMSVNRYFLTNGYETVTIGKIYHHESDELIGWSLPAIHPEGAWVGRGYVDEASKAMVNEYERANPHAKRQGLGPAFEHPEVPDDAYIDGHIAKDAIVQLNRLKDKPFFLAVGFYKPHLPFCAPKKYWDLYSDADIKLANNPFYPQGAPKFALTSWGELRGYIGMPKKDEPMPDDLARQLLHSYYACVSYADAQVGKVLDELDRLKLRDNTIIVLWGDNGWKLGEHSMWAKQTDYELDTHVPLIISAPGMKDRGRPTRALSEFVDIYPTLCDLCGLAKPSHLQGTSLVPLLANPDLSWKTAAFSQFPRKLGKEDLMGYAMRTDRYQFTRWVDQKDHTKVVAQELYDMQKDPEENTNIANDPANQALVEKLIGQWQAGWQGARPEPTIAP